jgi:hypothetical protein
MGEESSNIMGWSSTADVEIEAVGADAGGQVLAELVAEVETACTLTFLSWRSMGEEQPWVRYRLGHTIVS